MLQFSSIKEKPLSYFSEYFRGNGVCLCDKTITCKRMWEGLNASFAEEHGCLIIKNDSVFFGTAFDFPLKKENGDVDKALAFIEDYCVKTGQKLQFCCINAEEQGYLAKRYSRICCINNRSYRDYIYDREEIALFKGKKFAGQRNHINKFLSIYSNAIFRKISNNEKNRVLDFFDVWKKNVLKSKPKSSRKEFNIDVNFIKKANLDEYLSCVVEIDGEIKAFCLGEKVFDTTVIHIEKALHYYDGINVFMVREFAKICSTTYLNREDDAGEKGLRASKMQYHPIDIPPEYLVKVGNELEFLSRIPTIKTSRLTLNSIKSQDETQYYNLATDEKINEFWGYDYRKDLGDNPKIEDFYLTAKNDFKAKNALNFAIRLDGEFIGETVIYDFNYRGECKVGVRIFPEYAGKGYGEESFYASVDFALYNLSVNRVISYCYKDNIPSVKMHEKRMQKTGQDEKFYYYKKEY